MRSDGRVARPVGLNLRAADDERAGRREGQCLDNWLDHARRACATLPEQNKAVFGKLELCLQRRIFPAWLPFPIGDIANDMHLTHAMLKLVRHRVGDGMADCDQSGGMGKA